ncbi:MAG TPA: XrtA system polysaccharide deacetylase [Pyrinomonadaceae bacterium]|nr:XrtA system polysaccharide deacetylase [Pyrinomonadaceae bacterium]
MQDSEHKPEKRHLLTILLEDYFHVVAFEGLIQRRQWYRFETRFEQNTLKALDLLDRHRIKATFFVLGWIAENQPELVREVARRGHEIASRGLYRHRRARPMTPAEFREDVVRSREAIERASGAEVLGFRAARRWSRPSDLWALDVLAREGYAYDSSLAPISKGFRAEPWRRFAHRHACGDKEIWEFPISTCNLLGWRLPIAGGNYFRQIPHTLLKHVVEHWHQTYDAPFMMYAHVWELDPEQPRITGASPLARLRHYRNLDKMRWVLEDYINRYKFVGVGEYLGLRQPQYNAQESESFPLMVRERFERRRPVPPVVVTPEASDDARAARVPVSVVVPCYNEALTLPYLANTLKSLEAALAGDYTLRFIFVDDRSTDDTFDVLDKIFGAWPNSKIIRHARNLGVAAALLNGIRHAETEIVCSIDCDCTYDPHELQNMIPLLADDVDMVTASPYHADGAVRNVPRWRLSLSRGASFLYRQVLRQRLATYTSCFRVYRRGAVIEMRLRETGFLGVAETLGRLDLRGSKVVEHPATLEVRLFGQSKMKVVRTVFGHLRLLSRLLLMRLRAARDAAPPLPADAPQDDVIFIQTRTSPNINTHQ